MTTRKKHNKHPPLARASTGMYAASEWAIYGTTCAKVCALVEELSSQLAPEFEAVYVDADHSDEHLTTKLQVGKKQWSLARPLSWNTFDDNLTNWPADIALVNGNHYPATRQIVVIDDAKKDSLLKRVEQLTAIDVVICEELSAIYDFVQERMTADTQVISPTDIRQVANYLKEATAAATPNIKALILAGGKSSRMQVDKATISYHGEQPHEHYIASLCQQMGLETYLSKSYTFAADEAYGLPVLKDRLVDMGPLGAILTAFMQDPDAAWLVLACDLPFVDVEMIEHLVQHRKQSAYGTAYRVEGEHFPEPLMAIYEPKIYQRMLRFLSLGYACPRKVLINSDVHLLPLTDRTKAYNANTPEEREQAFKLLNPK